MAGNDESEGPGILVVSLKGDQRPVTREPAAGPQPRPQAPGVQPPGFPPPPATGFDANEAIFGAAQGAPVPAASAGSGLDLDEPAGASPKSSPAKRVRPELAEWGQQLVTGEHPAMAAVPPMPTPAPAPAAISGAHAASPRPPAAGRGKAAGAGLALLVVGGLGFAAWRMTAAPGPVSLDETAADPASAQAGAATSGFVLRPENAPDCWTRDDGFHFVYKAASGAEKAVSTIAEVPVLYRITARCVRD